MWQPIVIVGIIFLIFMYKQNNHNDNNNNNNNNNKTSTNTNNFIAINIACTTYTLTRSSMPNKLFFLMFHLPARFSKCIFFKKVFTQYWANPSELLKYTRSWCHTLKIIWCSVSTYIWIIIAFNSGKISPDLVIKCHKIIVVQWRVTYCFEATGDSVVHEISLSFFTRKHSHIHLPA